MGRRYVAYFCLSMLLLCSGCTSSLSSDQELVTGYLDRAMLEEASELDYVEDTVNEASYYLYGVDETETTCTAYTWVLTSGFDSEGDLVTGSSIPVRFNFVKGYDSYESYTTDIPEDGDYYEPSLNEIFPQNYIREIERQEQNQTSFVEKLEDSNYKKFAEDTGLKYFKGVIQQLDSNLIEVTNGEEVLTFDLPEGYDNLEIRDRVRILYDDSTVKSILVMNT